MDRFKQKIADLERDLAFLKAEVAAIKGTPPSSTDIHYATCSNEFGEYSLSDLDTFRFKVSKAGNFYTYTLTNPTPELTTYLSLQHRAFTTHWIQVEPSVYEDYCMKGNTPFVLTAEIRKCLESKLWEFAGMDSRKEIPGIKPIFTTDVIIPFSPRGADSREGYVIPPHISYYITPLPLQGRAIDITAELKEITTKQAVFQINYGNSHYKQTDNLKLHYAIMGIVKEEFDSDSSDD
jgi:hypothetical protein